MRWITALLALTLVACGTSGQVRQSYASTSSDRFTYEIVNTGGMTDEALGIFRKQLDASLTATGKLATGAGAGIKQVKIDIRTYRMRHGATRAMVGIMAGRDSIESTVVVTDDKGQVLGQIDIDSKNSTAWGTSGGLIEGHAEEIAAFVTGTKR